MRIADHGSELPQQHPGQFAAAHVTPFVVVGYIAHKRM
jgi:hypothetical protein